MKGSVDEPDPLALVAGELDDAAVLRQAGHVDEPDRRLRCP